MTINKKEKFTVITPSENDFLDDKINSFLANLETYLQQNIPHIVLNVENINLLQVPIGEHLATIQQKFYQNNFSFVICNLQPQPLAQLSKLDFFDSMNITPTQSEAWDILQMEEIERELFNDEN